MRTIFVTGGAGYVGSHCCKEFSDRGWRVVVYDNLSRGWRDMVRWGELITGDVRDADALGRAVAHTRPQLVAHFAALAYVEESVSRPECYWDVNVNGTLTLLQVMLEHGVRRLIFSSTCATYGRPDRVPLDESAPQRPVNPYGSSKLCAERLILDHATAYGLEYGILRYFNAAGASPDGDIGERHKPETHVIPLAIASALDEAAEFNIHGNDFDTPDGTCVRDYVHVTDLARAHGLAADRLANGGGGFIANLGTGRGLSVSEIADAVEAVTGRTLKRRVGPRRPGDPACLVASAEHARALLGWSPKCSTPLEIVESAVAWAAREARERPAQAA